MSASEIDYSSRPQITITPPPRQVEGNGYDGSDSEAAGEELSFRDVVDVVNPLHQIPVISSLYEAGTGDTAKPVARILGGLLFGGVIGLVAGIANAVIEQTTGKTIGGNVLAAITGEKGIDDSGQQLAANMEDNLEVVTDNKGNTLNPYLVASNFSGGSYTPPGSIIDSQA